MKAKMITFVLLAVLGTFYIGYGIANQKSEHEDLSNSGLQQKEILQEDLPDITRIEGIGIEDGYAYFMYRKGTKNYLGKIQLDEAVEVIPGE